MGGSSTRPRNKLRGNKREQAPALHMGGAGGVERPSAPHSSAPYGSTIPLRTAKRINSLKLVKFILCMM